ncbi:MAG: sulfotransferase, partial [Deltaproteobacteria bacterium]|nr:sulfotransferase [Deltaproteobacteria bacterium]
MHTSATRLPWALDALNHLELAVRKLGLRAIDLDPERLIAKARKQSAHTHYFDDYDFETPLRVLLDAYEREADLSLLGRVAVRTSTLLSLTSQLEIQSEYELHPEILDVPIERPVFILGFPRTGTTLLHNLLAQGLGARSPKLWELERPAPAIGPDTPAADPRRGKSANALTQTYRLVPHLKAVHAFDAEMPEECVVLFRKIFSCGSYAIDAHVPSHLDWFLKTDRLPIYRQLKKMLQLLMWKYPGHYPVLKSPLHLYSIDALLEVFPDARIIQTHRDPHTVAGSGCSLAEVLRTLYSMRPDPHMIGSDWVGGWGAAM